MIMEERTPTLRRWFSRSHHILGDGWLGDLDAEFQQLTVNPRCPPAWVVATHHPNQIANLVGYAGSTWLATMNLPRPEQTKALPVPSDDRLGLDDDQKGSPVGPNPPQPKPEDSVGGRQLHS